MSELSVNLKAATRPAEPAEPAVSGEQRLMQRLQLGDKTAMQELIDRHGPMLATLIGRLTAWHVDREDILQDVLMIVWQRAGSFRGDGSLEGWLKRMAINRCRNHFRAAKSIKRLIERFALAINPGRETGTKPGANESEPNPKLQLALESLSQPDRTAIVLFYLEEMSGDEVAKILNIKPETLHVRLHRARKKLKHLIEDTSAPVA